jgi:hypothetical protein
MISGRLWQLGVCVGALATTSTVYAYRNPERFGAPVQEGGGGGKFFTLSRAEGYGCAACHSQGAPIAVDIRGLPAIVVPGEQYRITLDWPDDRPSVALNVEMTTNDGAPFGQLIAPDPLTLSAADLCRVSDEPSSGQSVSIDAAGRRVLLIAECGQAQTSFDWISPLGLTEGYFSTSITFSNRNGKLDGDQVVDVSEPFGRQSAVKPPSSCAITGRAPTRFGALAWCLSVLALVARAATRHLTI